MKGIIITNAYWNSQTEYNQAERLKEEFNSMGVGIDIRRNIFLAYIKDTDIANLVQEYDFCVYLDKDKYLSQMLEKSGMKIFNSHQSIIDCDDKMQTFIKLSGSGIPMPSTYSGLLCYNEKEKLNTEALKTLEKSLGYPMIVKASYGSLGKDVYKADNREELELISNKLKSKPHLFQKFIAHSSGKDIRVIVINGKFIGAMMRESTQDFRSNIELGGQGKIFHADDELIKLCEKVSNVLGLDYCGIDMLFGESGYLVCEVNSNAFFGGIERVTGINIAKQYAQHIYNTIYGK